MPPPTPPTRNKIDTKNILLRHQLATIAETLIRASKRRDIEIQERLGRGTTPTRNTVPTTAQKAAASTDSSSGAGYRRTIEHEDSLSNTSMSLSGLDSPSPSSSSAAKVKTPIGIVRISDLGGYAGSLRFLALSDLMRVAGLDFVDKMDGNLAGKALIVADYATEITVVPRQDSLKVGLGVQLDQKNIMAELKGWRKEPAIPANYFKDAELVQLRTELTNLSHRRAEVLRSSMNVDSQSRCKAEGGSDLFTITPLIPKVLEKECVPYAIALQLERADCKWQEMFHWTKYLFGEGPGSYKAQREREEIIAHASKKYDEMAENAIKEEKMYWAAAEKSCLVVVSNIAADAGMKELEDAFEDFNVRSMRFLNGREPIKRTRVAEVYLYSKQSADRATRKIDHIFGLKIEVSRAVKSLLIPQGNRGGESCWSLPEVVMGAKSGETRMDE